MTFNPCPEPPYRCPRCLADPQPENFRSPRRCAFTNDGAFIPENWNCAAIGALFEAAGERRTDIYGTDESMNVFPVPLDRTETNGFLVFTRYKSRGRDSGAIHVGDFWPPAPVTLALVEETIAAYAALRRE